MTASLWSVIIVLMEVNGLQCKVKMVLMENGMATVINLGNNRIMLVTEGVEITLREENMQML